MGKGKARKGGGKGRRIIVGRWRGRRLEGEEGEDEDGRWEREESE